GPLGAAGAAGDLVEELKGPLGRAQIAAGEAEIGIDYADQRQQREVMPLCHHLRADEYVNEVAGDALDELGRGARAGQRVARHHRKPRRRKARRHLLGETLDAGTTGGEARGVAAIGTERRQRLAMAAMMALQPPVEAVLDQPSGAIRALQAETTAATE